MRGCRRSVLAALFVLVAAGCSGGGDASPPPRGPLVPVNCSAGTASLEGSFKAPNGTTPVGGASVSVSSAACTALTNAEGKFRFVNLPATPATVTAAKGNFSVSVLATPGGPPVTLIIPADSVKLAYVTGEYDSIESILAGLGFAPVELFAADLATTTLSAYDALFLNCGLDETYATDLATTTALGAFVSGGGTLYASDWAYVYVVAAFPGRVNMVAGDPRSGEATDAPFTAQVLDASLRAALGGSTAQITFDLWDWAVIDGVPAGTTVLIEGPVAYYVPGRVTATKPLAVQFSSGAGRVTLTSFHNEPQVTGDMQKLLESMVFGL
jgi:hypothetical protein